MRTWQLLVEPEPLPGPWNMAVDEHLFHLAGQSPRTFLRFYRWERPTASLGYTQEAARVVDVEFCRAQGIDIVMECTGIFTSKEKCQAHLENGSKRVLISAPGTDADATIVYGVNHGTLK